MQPVVATLSVRVPLNAAGGLADGAARIVERVDAVERVEQTEIRGLEPGLNDTTVKLRARIEFGGDREPDPDTLGRLLKEAVGVEAVRAVEREPPPTTVPAGGGR